MQSPAAYVVVGFAPAGEQALLLRGVAGLLRRIGEVEECECPTTREPVEGVTEHVPLAQDGLVLDPESRQRQPDQVFVEAASSLLIGRDVRMVMKSRGKLLIRKWGGIFGLHTLTALGCRRPRLGEKDPSCQEDSNNDTILEYK